MNSIDCPHCNTTNVKERNNYSHCVYCKKDLFSNNKNEKFDISYSGNRVQCPNCSTINITNNVEFVCVFCKERIDTRLAHLNKEKEHSKDRNTAESVNTAKVDEKGTIESQLEGLIGLKEVKDYMLSLKSQLKIMSERKRLGLKVNSQTLHMVFKGNPGTGKTTVARIVALLLNEMGLLRKNKLIEVDRSDLVAEYVGQTAIKTKKVIEKAVDGVLFIDEAYSLANDFGTNSTYGQEAIDTLVKGIEDYRDRLVVILAGYDNEMDLFMETNPGLKSRFPNVIAFKDYNINELMYIAENFFKDNDYIVEQEALNIIKLHFEQVKNSKNFGNARYVRNYFENIVRQQSVRVCTLSSFTKEILMTIKKEDLQQ